MKKFYSVVFFLSFLCCHNANAQSDETQKGTVVFSFDNSCNASVQPESAYVILDKYNLTGAGKVKDVFNLSDDKLQINDVPVGKYYADVFVQGVYHQHFTVVINVKKNAKTYTLKLRQVETYYSDEVRIPSESNDFTKTSVVLMK